ncbi:hypothetical protein [Microbispora sp. H10670]|uniref:hypothetical protein n=1 Tax=Microbispora sp. H10670 TaxID=2729108 RepID=UPI002872F72D|nr:hypothetical protein [Microbispora sp. H10670]
MTPSPEPGAQVRILQGAPPRGQVGHRPTWPFVSPAYWRFRHPVTPSDTWRCDGWVGQARVRRPGWFHLGGRERPPVSRITAGRSCHTIQVTRSPTGEGVSGERCTGSTTFSAPSNSPDWSASLERRLGRPVTAWSSEPKLDGLAIAARYRGGRLAQLVTRGDGTKGEDVSHVIGTIVGLPSRPAESPSSLDAPGRPVPRERPGAPGRQSSLSLQVVVLWRVVHQGLAPVDQR